MNNSAQNFWFADQRGAASLQLIRIGLSIVAIWYFVSHWEDINTWFSTEGILSSTRIGGFLDAADLTSDATWRWSPLYLTGEGVVLRAYLVIGILLAIATALTHRTRVPAIMLWLWCVWLSNRSLMISGTEELALCFGLGYLAIASPNDFHNRDLADKDASYSAPYSWTTAFSMRLIQVHTTLLIGLTGLTMLSAKIWWDGTGSVSVAAPIGRRLINVTELITNATTHEILSHAIIILALVCPIAIWFNATRKAAFFGLLIWYLIMAILSSQWMHLTTLAILMQSFRMSRWFGKTKEHSGEWAPS